MTEIWKDINNFKGLYKVSNLGRIKSIDRNVKNRTNIVKGVIISQRLSHNGYPRVRLNKLSNRYDLFVHKLVCETFNGDEKNKQVNHKNFIKHDNRPENLEWVTNSENIQYTYDNLMSKKQKLILDLSNGVYYYSIVEASNYNSINKDVLREMLNGKTQNKTSLVFA
jgi:hypothetical protein